MEIGHALTESIHRQSKDLHPRALRCTGMHGQLVHVVVEQGLVVVVLHIVHHFIRLAGIACRLAVVVDIRKQYRFPVQVDQRIVTQ